MSVSLKVNIALALRSSEVRNSKLLSGGEARLFLWFCLVARFRAREDAGKVR